MTFSSARIRAASKTSSSRSSSPDGASAVKEPSSAPNASMMSSGTGPRNRRNVYPAWYAVDVPAIRLDPLAGAVGEELRAHLLQEPRRRVVLAEQLRLVVGRVPGRHRVAIAGVEPADVRRSASGRGCRTDVHEPRLGSR